MRRERLRFPGALGGELVGRLESPDTEPTAFALFAHCFTCSKDLKAAGWISQALVERGIAVLRFDFTGLGESAGDFAASNFSSNLDDLVAAAGALRQRYRAPRILVGHSLGGAAVLAAAARIPESAAVATIGAPSSTAHLRDLLVKRAPALAEAEEAEVALGGRTFRIRRHLLADLEEEHLRPAIEHLHKPLLIFHSPLDEIVAIENAARIFVAAKHPKSFVSLDNADHLLTRERDARYVGEVLAAWAGRYVEGVEEEVERREEAGAPGQVLVVGGPAGLAQEIVARRHRLRADEPEEFGGTDSGPTPYDLLVAALGACTSMTLRLYADRKGLPLEGVRVRLRHDKIHAVDCAKCETKEGKIDRIERDIEVLGPLDADQRQRLLEIADRCPVHRTLTSEISIVSRLI